MNGIEIGTASAIGAALLGLVIYFLKVRDSRQTRVEKQTGDNTKDIAVTAQLLGGIEKRLSAGSESFKDITNTQKQLQETQTIILTEFVKTTTMEKEQDKTTRKFEKVDKSIEGLKETVNDVKLSVIGIENTMKGGIETMTGLLAKVVKIPKDKNDCDDE